MNMKLNNLTTSITKGMRFAGLKIQQHAPTILTVAGIAGGVVATVMACKATLKLEAVTETCTNDIHDAKLEKDSLPAKLYRTELAKAYLKACGRYVKLYAPSALVGIASIGCIAGSNRVLSNRYSSAVAGLTATEALFDEYRQRVKEDLGEQADLKYRYGLKEKTVETIDEKGKKHKEKVVDFDDAKLEDHFTKIFAEGTCSFWDKDYEMNICNLDQAEQHFNRLLKSRGYVFFDEVLEYLGYAVDDISHDCGWVFDRNRDVGKDLISFGLFNMDPKTGLSRADSMWAGNNAVLLTFNVQGYIRHKFVQAQTILG